MGNVLNRIWGREPQPDVWSTSPDEVVAAASGLHSITLIDGGIRLVDQGYGVLLRAMAPAAGDSETWTVQYWSVPVESPGMLPGVSMDLSHLGKDRITDFALQVIEAAEDPTGTFILERGDPATPEKGNMTGPQLVLWLLEQRCRIISDDTALRELYNRIPGLHITSIGGVAPFQVEGTWLEHPFYLRYRHDEVSLRIGSPRFPERSIVSAPVWSAYRDYTGPMNTVTELGDILLSLAHELTVTKALYVYRDNDPAHAHTLHDVRGSERTYPALIHINAFTRQEADRQLRAAYGDLDVTCVTEPSEDLTDPGPTPDFSGYDTATVRPI